MTNNPPPPPNIDFVTLGIFILDDIHPSPTSLTPPSLSIPGGAGLHSLLGARLHSPPPHLPPTISMILSPGPDFPPSLLSTLHTWHTSTLIRPRSTPTTRGWNGYSNHGVRAFKYLTEKSRVTAGDLTRELVGAGSFHLIGGAERCMVEVEGILSRRRGEVGEDVSPPWMVWEPVPDLCVPEEFDRTLRASRGVDVMSPNHDELAALFGAEHGETVDRGMVEEQAAKLVESGIGRDGDGAMVVRCGAVGCLVLSSKVKRWLPAYHHDASRGKVVDPTGGGNGFLGGLAVGLVRTGDLVEACRWGSVSASFCIEQVGVPVLERGEDDEGREKWNGVDVRERLDEFRRWTT